jgi:hypothetical protein
MSVLVFGWVVLTLIAIWVTFVSVVAPILALAKGFINKMSSGYWLLALGGNISLWWLVADNFPFVIGVK